MKARTRLSLLFTLITATILLAFATVVYYTAKENREKEFYSVLKKEAITKANLFFNAKVDKNTLQNIYHNNRKILNEVEVAIYSRHFDLLYHDAVDIDFVKESKKMIDDIYRKGEIEFYQDKWQVVGLRYNFQNKDYIVTAAAIDQYGYSKLDSLFKTTAFVFIISIMVIYLAGRFFSKKAFDPVKEITEKAANISIKNLDLRLTNNNSKDELSQLTNTFNEMLDRLENSFESQKQFDQVMEIVTGSAADLAVSIIGDDLLLMRAKADSIVNIMKSMPGSIGVDIEQEGMQEQLIIDIKREQIARNGINIIDIQNMIEAAIGGKNIADLYDNNKRYDIVVRYLPEYRNNIDEIKKILVPANNGLLIPMEQLADIHFEEGQTNIYRYNNKRMLTVRTNISGIDQGTFVSELQKKIKATIDVPKGYEIIYGGQYENLERASKRLIMIIPLTILGIIVILFFLYKNKTDVLITLCCIIFAIPGGVVALLTRDMYFNISAGVGFVSLSGIAVMTGILIINGIQLHLKNKEPIYEAIFHSSTEQFKVRLMVILLAMFGLIPAALSTGIGSDIQRPLATVIIGGLISTLIFAPILIPSLYLWISNKKKAT